MKLSLCGPRRTTGRILLVTAFLALAGLSVRAQAPSLAGQVLGRILGASPKEIAGAKVVLVKFTLDTQGVPAGAPIQMLSADAEGRYAFTEVPIDNHAVYKLGTRISGRLVASESFTFPEGKPVVRLDLVVPALVGDTNGLFFKQVVVAFEPVVGAVWVTEVMHVGNPTRSVIDAVNAPLELNLPPGASDLTMIREEQEAANHTHLGPKLLVYGRLQPGDTTIAFRYRVGAVLGTAELEKSYPHPVEEMIVLAPKGSLRLTSDQLSPRQPQELEGVTYDTWGSGQVPAQHTVHVRAHGIPVRQEVYLIPLAGFFITMGGVLWWFLHRRLPRETPAS